MSRIDLLLGLLDGVDLADLDERERFWTRTDRKYIAGAADLETLLGALPSGTRVVQTDAGRWHAYETTYFDTPSLDTFHLAARHRPGRCKIRTRRYVDADLTVAEVKIKNRRGNTVKHREVVSTSTEASIDAVRSLSRRVEATDAFADRLQPTLTNRYRRTTLVLPAAAGRVTIDTDFEAISADGVRTGLTNGFIVETKTSGKPSDVDRLLWGGGLRPIRFSKYSTALAAIDDGLPGNRWHRAVTRHLDRPGGPSCAAARRAFSDSSQLPLDRSPGPPGDLVPTHTSRGARA